jgi:hypothetical protein
MTTPIFPATLPNVSMSNYSFTPQDSTIRTEMEVGLARVRRRYLTTPSEMSVKWIFTREQLGIFEKFYDEEIHAGSAWFYIKLVNGMGETTYLARFKEPFTAATSGKEFYWDVGAKLEVLQRPLPA